MAPLSVMGKRSGVPTPVNKLLTGILLALTRGEIPLEPSSAVSRRN